MALFNFYRFILNLVVFSPIFLNHFVQGLDIYSNSFISPNSEGISKLGSKLLKGDHTLGPDNIKALSLTYETENFSTRIFRSKRSPEPILSRTSGIDEYTFKNIEESIDSNDVELSAGLAHYIQPSKTDRQAESKYYSGEDQGAPQARSLLLKEPQEIMPTATIKMKQEPQSTAISLPPMRGRQANPDIQDIITGIVKLLNGNVNVQANTGPSIGRPIHRPLSTRINNRGPPRITDVPALPPDFDMPAPPLPPPPLEQMPPPVAPTRIPTPYPFDLPIQNTSPARPMDHKRPTFYRPVTIPPWNRLRKPPKRPLSPPPYKPLPTEQNQDILTLDLGLNLEPSHDISQSLKRNLTQDFENKEFEKNKEKSSSKMIKHTVSIIANTTTPKMTTSTETSLSNLINSTVIEENLNTSIKEDNYNLNSTKTINETNEIIPTNVSSSSSTLFTSTATLTLLNSTDSISLNHSQDDQLKNEEIPLRLESSVEQVIHTLKEELLSTSVIHSPTEKLSTTTLHQIMTSSSINSLPTKMANFENKTRSNYYAYKPRPGIVLDDTEYKPQRQSIITRPPIGDIFDVTVSAIQGTNSGQGQGKPFVIPVDIESVHGDVITSPVGNEGFVSIDGKRTYLNLFDNPSTTSVSLSAIKPSPPSLMKSSPLGSSSYYEHKQSNLPSVKPTQRRPIYGRPRPSNNQPPVRIDTCIVGDDSTCDGSQHEICRTEAGVSACHCRPGHARRKYRDPCRKIVSVLVSLRVDRLYEKRIIWSSELGDKNSESYQQLSFEAERALDSAMSMTPFSDEFLAAKVNNIYKGQRVEGHYGVFINMTLQLDENADTARTSVKADIQKHLLGVIQRRSNNVGNSALWVDSPPGSVSNLQDLDECSSPELHDCHVLAKCTNIFGGFKCECEEGYRDPWADSKHRAGRQCEQCSSQYCNNRGECKYQNGQEVCMCSGNYYGNQCEFDGEVLGVAIGASVAAVIIIGLTLVCLVMWSRRWSREHKAAVGSPVFGYMATASNTVKTPVIGAPPYQLTLEDRLRWAQLADVMAQANHYAPEPVPIPTRPSSALFGYPPLNTIQRGTLQNGGTLPPVPLPRLNLQAQMANRAANIHGMRILDNSSSSEEEDKADLLERNFQVPRPKSRSSASIANQSGIYYDVDYDQNEIYKQAGGIPLSTYSMGRATYYRN